MVDGHLDLAYNVLAAGRDLTRPLGELRRGGHPDALLTLPELAEGGVRVVFGTLFVRPAAAMPMSRGGAPLGGRAYETPGEARALALEQLELYERWEDEGRVRIVRTKGDLEPYTRPADGLPTGLPTGLVVLMEGADPLRTPDDLAEWRGRGLRIVGPAWQRTRYAGGTKAPGPLTDLGAELMHAMRQEGVILDVSHLAEESFWNALEAGPDRVIASHSNAHTLVPTDRHLSDAMIRALGAKGGVMGLVIANPFLNPDATGANSATLADVKRHAEHAAGLIGWDKLAVGTDWDGGFGVPDVPAEITRAADFARLGEAVPEEIRSDFLGGTWLKFLQDALPE